MTDNRLPASADRTRVPADPFSELQQRIDSLFSDFSRGLPRGWDLRLPRGVWGSDGEVMPSMEMHETDGKVTLTAELPGVEEKDITVTADEDMLTISGEKKSEFESKDGKVTRSERTYGKFSRSVRLPFAIDPGKVDARFDKGVLTLTIDRPASATPRARRIEIRH